LNFFYVVSKINDDDADELFKITFCVGLQRVPYTPYSISSLFRYNHKKITFFTAVPYNM